MERCTKCVLTSKMPSITFNEEGVCNYCLSYRKNTLKGEQELLKILDSHRGKGKYDCMVTVSGGRDSSYVLLKMVKDYNMKVLAVNYDNPFTPTPTKANINNMIHALNVDFTQFRHKNQLHERTLQHYLKIWLKRPSVAAAPMVCIGCRLMFREFIRIARKHDIHLIVGGCNPLEDTSFIKASLNIPEDGLNKFASPRNLPGLALGAIQHLPFLGPRHLPTTIKSFLFTTPTAIGSSLLGHGIDRVDLFYYLKWDEKELLSRIQSELNWRGPDKTDKTTATWRFDCKIASLRDYMYFRTMGMTQKDDFYSKMIREGQITRDEALIRLDKENIIQNDIVEEILGEPITQKQSTINV